ncbi:hypothetical protein GCM10009839_04170 [Catenulispora yoronensis]|uniref:Putative Flp pilus-assembly TadG-like N-terminal domain-containing protein n=1 Tax=Catenulispora yoronensis TaxID=450799 RepID=A0ABN2TKT6_9ACTN
MSTRRERLRAALRDDQGSLSMAVVIWAPVVVVLMAFLVDVGLLISDRTDASDLADQAARKVAQNVDQGWLKTHNVRSLKGENPGIMVDVDPTTGDCVPIARQYLVDNGIQDATITACRVDGNPTEQDLYVNPRITVTLRMQYKPLFVGFALKGDSTVTATGTATPVIPK